MFAQKPSYMGKGFNISHHKEENSVAEMFDRLVRNMEESVTRMKYEYIFHWIVKQNKEIIIISKDDGKEKLILDICCGFGLPKQ